MRGFIDDTKAIGSDVVAVKSQSAFVRGFIDDLVLFVLVIVILMMVSIRVRARLHR